MRIQITQVKLNRALSLLSRVASSKTSLPILSNILFKAHKGNLELAATNLEVAITHTTHGKIDEEGSVTVPARLLHEFISQLPKDSTIDLVFEKNKLFISAGTYSSHIQGSSAEEFPALPTIKAGSKVILDVSELQNAINRTILAVSHDETRPILSGLYLHTIEGVLYLAATDGYRLAEATILGKIDHEVEYVLPTQTMQEVLKIVQDTNETEVELLFDEGQFGIICGETQLVSRLIDGQYPKYRQLIPEKSDIRFEVNREELLTASKLAGLFARESGGSITIRASESEKNVVVSSVASQVGDNTSTINGSVEGSGEVVVNVRYLTDALNCFDSETITFRFTDSISPCVITSSEQPGYQHIVMPLKS